LAVRQHASLLAGSLVLSLLAAACGGVEPPPTPTPDVATTGPTGAPSPSPSPTPLPPAILEPSMTADELFDDDTSPGELGLVERSRAPRDRAIVRDVRFIRADGSEVPAYIVAPAAGKASAGILFLHWLGEDFSSREEFLTEAVGLAASGVESMLITQDFPWTNRPTSVDHDRVALGLQVRTILRAITLLRAEVGPAPVALVGHDYGAMNGILAASVDHGLTAVACMAPDSTWVNWFVTYFHLDADGYAQAMADLDPVTRVEAVTAPLLFQFGTSDTFVSASAADALAGAAPGGTVVQHYDTGHRLDSDARRDRDAWLLQKLGLPPPKPS
jgi:pimeloyl-ACP methyl ester carboxylesterase